MTDENLFYEFRTWFHTLNELQQTIVRKLLHDYKLLGLSQDDTLRLIMTTWKETHK